MSRAAMLARGRIAAENGMVDACTIRRPADVGTDGNGNVITTRADVYAGKCRIQQRMGESTSQSPGESYQLLLRLEVQLPMSVTGLQVGDEVTVTSSVSDPDLPGRVFLVRDLAHKSDATARRVGLTERTS
jgi:hypothetical protein